MQKSLVPRVKDSKDNDDEKEETVTDYSVTPLSVAEAQAKQAEERYTHVIDVPACTVQSNFGFEPSTETQKNGLQFIKFIAFISPALAALKNTPTTNLMCALGAYRSKGHTSIRSMYPYDTCDVMCDSCGYHERFDIMPLVEHHFSCPQGAGKTIEHVPDISKLANYKTRVRPADIRSGKGIVTICPSYFCEQEKLGKELWMPAVYDRWRYKAEQLNITYESMQKFKNLEKTDPSFKAQLQAMQNHATGKCSQQTKK